MTSQTNSSNTTLRYVQALVIATCVGTTNPSLSAQISNVVKKDFSKTIKVNYVPQIVWDSNTFHIKGQRFMPSRSKPGLEGDDVDYNIAVKSSPVEEFWVKANIVSVEDYTPHVFVDEIYFDD